MTAGFALVAWPVRYDETGVMTFIVNYEGQIYEKNLGPRTDAVARKMTLFDPDSSWRKGIAMRRYLLALVFAGAVDRRLHLLPDGAGNRS